MPNIFPVIDLFAGAGGIGLGVQAAGGQVCLSVELDKVCCLTLEQNRALHPKGSIINGDVSTFSGQEMRKLAGLSRKEPLIVVGGPPCQPFSKASYWTDPGEDSRFRRARAKGYTVDKPAPITEARSDGRRSLVDIFLDRIIESEADGFLFENVKGILHPRNITIVENFIKRAEEFGYKCQLIKANAAEFGVPQVRERVFVLGAKNSRPVPPQPTHSESQEKYKCRDPYVTAGEALLGLSDDSYHEQGEIVSGRWEEEFREIPPGWNYKALTAWAGHPNPVFEAETRFWNFLLKLSPDKPSWTIAANPGPWTGPFHWNNRRLRTVEMAALQTFPHGYFFSGNRREKVRQIGNAAPPVLVKQMAEKVFEAILQNTKRGMAV
jgi:DNA (cytosine-5)-methyltransferase 1